MSSLLHPPAHLSPAVALQLSQQAPRVLQTSPGWLSAAETADTWAAFENLMLSCLRTGDEAAAQECLQRLTTRFGESNERIMALQGIFKEATAKDDELPEVLREYDDILSDDASNVPVAKRRIALLQSMGRPADAIAALTQFLDTFPTDAEAWCELSDLYIQQGLYPQAIFALEEVLLVTPNAWNIHAKLGETLYMAARETPKYLDEAVRRFCRSVELCENYLRGYYGLKLSTKRLGTMPKLHEQATEKLAEIVRRGSAGEPGWTGYDEAELIAARALLDGDAASGPR